mgnify:CR=1 FL=1
MRHLLPEGTDRAAAVPPVGLVRLEDEALWQPPIDSIVAVVHGERCTSRAIGEVLDYRIAGKTVTAQVIGIAQGEEYYEAAIDARHRDHALFTAFAPATSPRLVVTVLVENGGSGSTTAAPTARRVIDAWMNREEQGSELGRESR